MNSMDRGSPLAAHFQDQGDFIHPADLEARMSRMSFHEAGSRPASVHSASAISVGGKNFVYLSFKRKGDDWYQATTTEIPAPQADLERLVKKNKGKALPMVETMADTRRKQIQQMANELSAQEVGDVYWEPAYIKTTDESLSPSGKRSIKAFKVIFARQRPSKVGASPPSGRPLNPRKVSVKQAVPPRVEKPRAEEKPQVRPTPARRLSALNDPFSTTTLFGLEGQPMDSRGYVQFANAGLPANIRPDRPIGQKPVLPEIRPREEQREEKMERVGKHEQDRAEQPNFSDDILDGIFPGNGAEAGALDESGEFIDVEGIAQKRDRERERSGSRPRAPSKSRRRSSALREGMSYRHTGSRHADYPSSRSSWASDNSSAIMGEWDEMGSKTSDETQHSYARSPARKIYRMPAGRQYSRESRYRRDEQANRGDREAKIVVADSRKLPPVIEPRHERAAIEQPQPRTQPSPRPMVHQLAPPHRSQPVPPQAEWPDAYQPEQEKVSYADDYMRTKIREEDHRKHEQAAAQQNRDYYGTQGYGAGYGGAKRQYTYDPRQPYFAR